MLSHAGPIWFASFKGSLNAAQISHWAHFLKRNTVSDGRDPEVKTTFVTRCVTESKDLT